ncbi:hypothetical protein BS50DRAFT_637272 [Corynespora cassiicola Philippines]|uniref:Uncharacterized protein n=1 Tax=Corynespora cassiicola Philippines TaxID=1448308 RepID=A0A2T2NES9_CORCC|nr:hypothetical protein BS50DRAFT_637272 [Corynespora cassiicola Philippines]
MPSTKKAWDFDWRRGPPSRLPSPSSPSPSPGSSPELSPRSSQTSLNSRPSTPPKRDFGGNWRANAAPPPPAVPCSAPKALEAGSFYYLPEVVPTDSLLYRELERSNNLGAMGHPALLLGQEGGVATIMICSSHKGAGLRNKPEAYKSQYHLLGSHPNAEHGAGVLELTKDSKPFDKATYACVGSVYKTEIYQLEMFFHGKNQGKHEVRLSSEALQRLQDKYLVH